MPADLIWVSLDGTGDVHDRLRSGSFDRVWANLKLAGHVNNGARFMIHFTMNRMNWRELESLAEKLEELPVIQGITVQLFYPYGQGETSLELSDKERREALEQVIRLKKSHRILNSKRSLRRMILNDWRCHEDLLINVDPDGRITQGCYAKERHIDCRRCGFTPVAEASAALNLHPGAIMAGWRAYLA